VGSPDGIAVGPDGALWFTNHGNASIGRITTSGRITNYTGTGISGPDGIVAGPDGAMWFTNQSNSSIGRITTAVTPQISGFTPASGAPGTTVTISGINLSQATMVTFAGTTATISSDTATTIVTAVPTGATSGPISVTTPAGTTTSSQIFTVT
jgi:streptogramin lyase